MLRRFTDGGPGARAWVVDAAVFNSNNDSNQHVRPTLFKSRTIERQKRLKHKRWTLNEHTNISLSQFQTFSVYVYSYILLRLLIRPRDSNPSLI